MFNKTLKNSIIYTVGAIGLVGCGSSGGGNGDNSTITSRFIDRDVIGISVKKDDATILKTEQNGEFKCKKGEKLAFGYGNKNFVQIGEDTECKEIITPVDLVNNATDANNEEVISAAQIFQSTDDDNNPDNGINIPENIHEQVDSQNISSVDLTSESDVNDFISEISAPSYVTRDDAQKHLKNSLDVIVTGLKLKGVWIGESKIEDPQYCTYKLRLENINLEDNKFTGTLTTVLFDDNSVHYDSAGVAWNGSSVLCYDGYSETITGELTSNGAYNISNYGIKAEKVSDNRYEGTLWGTGTFYLDKQ